MSDADPKHPPGAELTFLNAEEWARERDSLMALRLMLAGLGLRFACDAEGKKANAALSSDIGLLQQHVQRLIDQAQTNEAAIRQWLQAFGAEPPVARGADHGASGARILSVETAVFELIEATVGKWRESYGKLRTLLEAIGTLANECGDKKTALRLVEAMEAVSAQWNAVTAIEHQIHFLAQSADPAERSAAGSSLH
ncbi:MAG TPA: hypothetical protein VFB08_02185 [Burkholderiales bacterium]|nr:hypothetical protein [Burkholderiales bacterium]